MYPVPMHESTAVCSSRIAQLGVATTAQHTTAQHIHYEYMRPLLCTVTALLLTLLLSL